MREGDAAYGAKNYSAAVAAYQRVFEREQAQPKLDKKLWYGLTENLADSYTHTGDVRNARVVLAQGISKDYKFPMFYYILARTYAEEGNEIQTITHIQKAYENKKNLPAGRTLPDPMTDESFAAFADSAEFKKAVSRMSARTK